MTQAARLRTSPTGPPGPKAVALSDPSGPPITAGAPKRLLLTEGNHSYKMKANLFALVGKEHTLRILLVLRSQGPQRFSDIQKSTNLNPAQLDRSLKLLRKDLWVIPETIPGEEGPVRVRYRISKRGDALLKALDAFGTSLKRQRVTLGEETIREFEAVYS